MWIVAQSGELVNISEARWIDCVIEGEPGRPEWWVRAFYTGREQGPHLRIVYRSSEEAEARAVLYGITTLLGAYSLKRVQGYGEYAALGEDRGIGLEGGRVIPLEEPVLSGVKDNII